MKDIHSHILYGIDDGSRSIEESIKIIEGAVKNGYTDIIVTPHYRESQGFVASNKNKREVLENLQEELDKRNIKINLYLGNEVTVDGDLFLHIKEKKITTLNKSRYMLIELPFDTKLSSIHELIFSLVSKGVTPIIAHPERYIPYYGHYEEYEQMIEEGALFQGNLATLYGKYGEDSKEMLKGMLMRHMIHFIGSDIHHSDSHSYYRINDGIDRITQLTGSYDMSMELVDRNIDKVIKNLNIEPYEVRHLVKKSRFKLFKRKINN